MRTLRSPVEPYRPYATVRLHSRGRAAAGGEVRDGDAGNVTVTCGRRAELHALFMRRHIRPIGQRFAVERNSLYARVKLHSAPWTRGRAASKRDVSVTFPASPCRLSPQRAVPVTSPRRDTVPAPVPPQNLPTRASRRRPQPARVASETPGLPSPAAGPGPSPVPAARPDPRVGAATRFAWGNANCTVLLRRDANAGLASFDRVPLTRPFAIAFAALLAALCLVAVVAPTAPAEDLSSELESKESALEETQQRKGVLTTTITRYARQVERLSARGGDDPRTGGRDPRPARTRPSSGWRRASDELEAAHDRLARMRSHLRVALGSLRERLVAIYEQGSPELLDVLIGEGDLEDVEARAEFLDRIHEADEANAQRVRSLRDGVALTVEQRAAAKGEIEAARNSIAAEERALIATRGELQGRQSELVDARGGQEAALAQVRHHETELDGDVESIQAKIAEELAATGTMPLPPGAIKAGLRLDDLAGRRADRLRLRRPHDRRPLRVPPGDRHRGAGRHADPRRPRRAPSPSPSRRPKAAATATTPASTTAAVSPPVTPTNPPSPSTPGSRSNRAR